MSLVYSTKGKVKETTTNIVGVKANDYRPIKREGNKELWARFVKGVMVEKKWKRIGYKNWY